MVPTNTLGNTVISELFIRAELGQQLELIKVRFQAKVRQKFYLDLFKSRNIGEILGFKGEFNQRIHVRIPCFDFEIGYVIFRYSFYFYLPHILYFLNHSDKDVSFLKLHTGLSSWAQNLLTKAPSMCYCDHSEILSKF